MTKIIQVAYRLNWIFKQHLKGNKHKGDTGF